MASVYNLIGNPSGVSREIIREHGRLEMPIRIRYFAALTIQRCYRGYKVRCIVRYWHNMATVIQKVVRGWLVRWHRVDYLKQYLARMEERDLNNNARKIQAFYRGYQVRKTLSMPIKELVKQKQLTEQQSANMREIMRQKFQALRLYGRRSSVSISQDIDQDTMGEECKRWVLFILFKTHHLIRTYCKEGIYSIHGSKYASHKMNTFFLSFLSEYQVFNDEQIGALYSPIQHTNTIFTKPTCHSTSFMASRLSQLECWMKSLPIRRYMQELRQLYNQNYTDEQIIEYIFQDKRLQHYEYLYRTRDKSRETKPSANYSVDKNIHPKPFDLYKRPEKKPYERLILNMDKYTRLKTELLRSYSKLSSDFDVFSHKPGQPPSYPPPYYIDFWNVTCKIHYPPTD